MGLSKVIQKLTGVEIVVPARAKNNKEFKENSRKWPKYVAPTRVYNSKRLNFEGYPEVTVILDNNRQVCGGTYLASHKGRPCVVSGKQVLCAKTAIDEEGKPYFCGYEVLIDQTDE